ncbi:hypothetical protein D1872_291300 [compost metagenome]
MWRGLFDVTLTDATIIVAEGVSTILELESMPSTIVFLRSLIPGALTVWRTLG